MERYLYNLFLIWKMGKRNNLVKYYYISFLIIVAIIFIIAILYFGSIKTEIEQFVSQYGYTVVFFLSFFIDIIMQPIGPDFVIVSGIMVELNPFLVLAIVSLASILASFLNFWLGKKYGKIGFTKLFGKKRFENYKKYYKKYGKYALLVSSLTPVPYVPFCWASGLFNFKARTFTYFGIIPRILRFSVVALLANNIYHFLF